MAAQPQSTRWGGRPDGQRRAFAFWFIALTLVTFWGALGSIGHSLGLFTVLSTLTGAAAVTAGAMTLEHSLRPPGEASPVSAYQREAAAGGSLGQVQ